MEQGKKNRLLTWLGTDFAKACFGYFLTAATMVSLTLIIHFLGIVNPNMILIAGLTVFTAIFGYGPGILAAIDMLVYSWYVFSDKTFTTFTDVGVQKFVVAAIGTLITLIFVAELHRRHYRATHKLEEDNTALHEENNVLQHATLTDPLTGINNRLAYRTAFPSLIGKKIFIAMIDIDDFKTINDTQGHPLGDHLLRKVARALSGSFGMDHCYRYGGDEFLVAMGDVSSADFLEYLTAAENFVASPGRNHDYGRVTISAGFVYGVPENEDDLRLMLAAADYNLYRAKKNGKASHVGSEFTREAAQAIDKDAHSHHYDPND
ncbi:MAG: diguanylate cyclase [Erysipelotrichaceae bacterium]|nr:diguanylate cyclase [Erysipelotrichaceae bacterium]